MPLRRRSAVLAAALCTVAMVAVACSSSSSSKAGGGTQNTASSGTKYDTNATLTYFIAAEASNWNINTSDGNEFETVEMMDRVYPSVFHIQPDFTVALDKNFVLSADQTNANPQTIVYKINPKAVWSDGTPITADDFIYNWQTQNGDASLKDTDGKAYNPATTAGYEQIQSVTSLNNDPYTVQVVFKKPFQDWKGIFGSDNPLVQAKFAKQVGWNSGFTDPTKIPAGGPFMIQSYTKGQSLTLVRNPKYWGPPANLASVTFRFLADSNTWAQALQNGEVNAGYPTPQVDLVNTLKNIPGLKLDLRSGLEYEHLDMNESNKWLKDPALRHAIMLSIDRNALIAKTVGQFVPNVKPTNDRMFVNVQPQYKDNSGGLFDKADIPGAQKILTDAGYTLANGKLTKGGQAVALRITTKAGDSLRADEAQYVVSQLQQLGITVTPNTTSKQGSTLAKGDFDLMIFAWVTTPFPSGNDPVYMSNGGNNFDKHVDPQVDALINQAEATSDAAKRADLYNQADAQMWKGFNTYPFFLRPTLLVYQDKYLNMVNNASAEGPTYNMEDWGVKAG